MSTDRHTILGLGRVPNPTMYVIRIEIDVECQELLDICGIDYEISKKDICICKVILNLNKDEFEDELKNLTLTKVNKKDVTERLLVPEIAQYTKKVTIEKPTGNIISFI